MKQGHKRQQGSSLVELLLVLTLISVFGLCLFSLIFAGSSAYQRLESSRTVEGDARVAISFVNVKVRQNDAAGCVQVVALDNGTNALLLTDPEQADVNTWVFFDNGTLYECLVAAGMPPELGAANVIAQLEDCDIQAEDGGIRVTVTYWRNGAPGQMNTTIALRSDH